MRSPAILSGILLAAGLSRAAEYQVAGTVVDSESHAPLAHAHVSLAPTSARHQKMEQVTKQDGRFSFSVKEHGKYALQMIKPGYPTQTYRQARYSGLSSAIVARDEQDNRNIVFEARRGGVITGVIQDEESERVANAQVSIFQATVVGGERKIVSRGQTNTNAAGEFRFYNLPPGNYYVCAVGRPWFADNMIQIDAMRAATNNLVRLHGDAAEEHSADEAQYKPEYSADPGLRGTAFPATFYPRAPNIEEASLVGVGSGGETQISIMLPLAKAVSVKGTIRLPGDMSDGRANLTKKFQGQFALLQQTWVRKEGEFEFENVPPGSYEIAAASWSPSGVSSWSIRQEIEVGSSDVEVALRPQSMGSVSGHVLFDGEPSTAIPNLSISFRSERNNAYGARVDPLGNFSVNRLAAGRYEVTANAKDHIAAYFAGPSGEHLPLTIEVGSGEAVQRDLMLTKAVSVIEGTVEKGAAPSVGAFVLLMPKNPAQRWAYRVDQTDSDGTYRLATIPTGDYFVIALSDGEDVAYRDPKVAAILAGIGAPIHVEPGEHVERKLEPVDTGSLQLWPAR